MVTSKGVVPVAVRSAVRLLAALVLAVGLFPATPVLAVENVFTSTAAVKEEAGRIGDESLLFATGPVDPYWVQTIAAAGAFAAAYVYDRDIRSDLAGVHTSTLDHVTRWGSLAGDPYIHLGVAATLYGAGALTDSPRVLLLGQKLGEALLLADGTTLILKEAVGRARPEAGKGESDYRPFRFDGDYSLPSMHTASSFAVAHVLAAESDSWGVKALCYTGATLVGFSRLYRDQHWASDVVLGAAIGELAGSAVTRYYDLHGAKVTVTPASLGGAPGLALSGRF
ncbi:phosphatase PAP2 family protein [Geomonas sp. Red32]|uniref:phosphatase PAP2 family protein n=1 Tax=Geomonas sp. Red32 TaxID=2912856 RepID=UPI00202CE4A4|nr:phosphatase PAP2 family protein [Geomonas sp. Red32]MCM0082318.1 phosphatase PAP2 family protein [Geomonas sp. Red32]